MKNKKLKRNEERKIGIEKMKIDVKTKRKKAGKIEDKENKKYKEIQKKIKVVRERHMTEMIKK